MSAYEPPTIISTIYNPAFFETSATNTITQAQANALYLKKKTADTATALETFSAGIATTSLAASSFATVGGTLGVTGVLTGTGNINTNSLGSIGGTLALGGLDIINLGTSGGRSAACSINTVGTGLTAIAGNVGQTIRMFGATQGTEYQYDNTNLIVGTQNMALYSTQTSGRLDIGTGARLLTGQGGGINVGTGSGGVANPITIGGASSALTLNGGNISIGNSFSTTTLNGVISFANLAIDSVDRATAGTLSLGTSIANLVNISRSTINTAILGTLSVAEATTTTGLLTATGGLTMGTGKNITLSSGTVAPVSGELGFIQSVTANAAISSTMVSNSNYSYGSTTISQAGTYIIMVTGSSTAGSPSPIIQARNCNITTGGSINGVTGIITGATTIAVNQIGESGNLNATSYSQSYSNCVTYYNPTATSVLISFNILLIFSTGVCNTGTSNYRFTITRIA